MSAYSSRVAQDSPLFYFENNSSGINNTGSQSITPTTGTLNTFQSTGGVSNSAYMVSGARNGDSGFEYTNTTALFNDRVFSITGWLKVSSTDVSSALNWVFHTGTTAQGIYLQLTGGRLYTGATFNAVSVSDAAQPAGLAYDTWHHYAVTMDTTSLKLYLNGNLIETKTSPATLSMDSAQKYWMRETTSGTPRTGAKGNFDEWALFNTTLSATTISDHYTLGFGVKYAAEPATATGKLLGPNLTPYEKVVNELAVQPKWWFKMQESNAALVSYGTYRNAAGEPFTSANRVGPSAGVVLETSGGKSGNYFDFPYGNDATNGRAYFVVDPSTDDTAAIFQHAQDWTFEFFMRMPTVTGSNSTNYTIFKMFSSGSEEIKTYVPNSNQGDPGKLVFFMTGVSTSISAKSTNRVDDNNWHHVAIRHNYNAANASLSTTQLYIDGSLNETVTHGSVGNTYKIFDRYSNMSIAADSSSASTSSYLGDLDDFLMYGYSLTPQQIYDNYAAATSAAVDVSPAADPMVANTGTFVMPVISTIRNVDYAAADATASAVFTEAVITVEAEVIYSAAPATASAESGADPIITSDDDLLYSADPSTASALFVDPTFSAQQQVNYLAEPATASALAVDPTVISDDEVVYSASPATADAYFHMPVISANGEILAVHLEVSALFVDPTVTSDDELIYDADPATASGLFGDPSIDATDTVSLSVDVATASALSVMPAIQIAEDNLGTPIIASALFVMPGVSTTRNLNYASNPGTIFASAVMPAVTTQELGVVLVSPMTASAFSPLPLRYFNPFSDVWYQTLYLQHSILHQETGNTAGVSSASAFLKLFDDVTSNLDASNINQIPNNLPISIITNNPTNTSTTTVYATGSNEFSTATPTPILETGFFDPYQRKSVRFRNIQFTIPEDVYMSDNPYSFELTFKTTKADQVIAQGLKRSFTGTQSATSTIGLINGKLYATRLTQDAAIGRIFAHPDNLGVVQASRMTTAYGNKSIADGAWHHLIVQYGFDGRVQFWIDGQLDIQFFGDNVAAKGASIRPYILGSNNTNPRWQSDFETSALSYDAAYFVPSQDISLHYTASIKYEPYKAEVATATASLPEPVVGGNRPRALMLYFWPTAQEQLTGIYNFGGFTSEGPEELTTLDYFTAAPENYEGWDIFPVDITGRWVSDLVKPEAYGVENIGLTTLTQYVNPYSKPDTKTVKVNQRNTFRDAITDAPRYIDLVKDIDLSKFDLIMFKNYPNDPAEKDSFTGNEVVDAYFNLRESKIFEDFVKSLRAAVDTGLGLFVNNAQLALDLKIVDRVEVVPDMDNGQSDPYAPTQVPQGSSLPTTGYTGIGWYDTYKNNRGRVVNLQPGVTDNGGLVRTQVAFWRNVDEFRFGGADRAFTRYEHKNNLAVGDEFVLANYGFYDRHYNTYLAAPIANVKAGKVITAFANTVRRELDSITNPYRNHAISIVLNPGDILDGRQIGGKIYVNFTEELNKLEEQGSVDLNSVYWANYAYDNGAISLAERDALLADPTTSAQTPYWSSDGMNILVQANELQDENFNRPGLQTAPAKIRKVNKNGGISFQAVASGSLWFTTTFSYQYPRALFEVPSSITNGFRWLSNREFIDGILMRPEAFNGSAEFPSPTVIVDKETEFHAQSLLAIATLNETAFTSGEKKILSLPLLAEATMVTPGSTIAVDSMISAASMLPNGRAIVAAEDEVILYIMHVDPILYIREDVIK